jgi:hypothetical protein
MSYTDRVTIKKDYDGPRDELRPDATDAEREAYYEIEANCPTMVVVDWREWLQLAPKVGRVLDEETVLVRDPCPRELWHEMCQEARKVCEFDTEVEEQHDG